MDDMHSARQFLQYAEACKRLAEKADPKDRTVLLEMANAWRRCAKEAERETARGDDSDREFPE
jgi:hypothetical protein